MRTLIEINDRAEPLFLTTTGIAFHELDNNCVEARVGICFGDRSSMDMLEADACEHNPFHADFTDPYIRAFGPTKEVAEKRLCYALAILPGMVEEA